MMDHSCVITWDSNNEILDAAESDRLVLLTADIDGNHDGKPL